MSERKAYVIMLISIPVLWIAVVQITGVPSFLLPGPDLVAKVLWQERDIFVFNASVTVMEALVGYTIANIIAVGLAIGFLYITGLECFTTPWMVVVRNIPFLAIAAILVITLGDTPAPKIIIVVLVCFFPILINVTKGLKAADSVLLDRMRVLNASKWQIFTKVRWAIALPYYIAAHEIAFTGSIMGAILAEYMFASQGLGFIMVRALMQYRADRLYALTLIASILAISVYIFVKMVEKRLFQWKADDQRI